MARENLLSVLGKQVLLCDGAMGTQLFARGLQPGVCGDRWNIERPNVLEQVHTAYRQAGCRLLTTNTFNATVPNLEKHNLAHQVEAINAAGAQIARKVAGDDAWVLGDIGPFGGFLEPLGDMTEGQLLGIFSQQAQALRDGGADAAIIETMSDPVEMAVAIRAARSVADWPVIATYAFERGDGQTFRTMMGSSAADAAQAAIDAGANVIGANCGSSLGLDDYVKLAGQLLAAAGTTPVIIQANAGSPQTIDGQLVYPASPADMANLATRLRQAGVKIIGGCCGTTPQHLAAMAGA